MILENISITEETPAVDTSAASTNPVLDVLTELVETVAELVEKIHELERSIAYSLGER